jgi:hypothetical protein
MRMDIEISPRAPAQRVDAPSRDDWGRAARKQAGRRGVMTGKRVCSVRHPATVRRERRFIEEQMKGILWRHSSFNLVEPRSFAPGAVWIPRRAPESKSRVASRSPRCNHGGGDRRTRD